MQRDAAARRGRGHAVAREARQAADREERRQRPAAWDPMVSEEARASDRNRERGDQVWQLVIRRE